MHRLVTVCISRRSLRASQSDSAERKSPKTPPPSASSTANSTVSSRFFSFGRSSRSSRWHRRRKGDVARSPSLGSQASSCPDDHFLRVARPITVSAEDAADSAETFGLLSGGGGGVNSVAPGNQEAIATITDGVCCSKEPDPDATSANLSCNADADLDGEAVAADVNDNHPDVDTVKPADHTYSDICASAVSEDDSEILGSSNFQTNGLLSATSIAAAAAAAADETDAVIVINDDADCDEDEAIPPPPPPRLFERRRQFRDRLLPLSASMESGLAASPSATATGASSPIGDVRQLCHELASVKLMLHRLRRLLHDNSISDDQAVNHNDNDDDVNVVEPVCKACGCSPAEMARLKSELAELRLLLAKTHAADQIDEIGFDGENGF